MLCVIGRYFRRVWRVLAEHLNDIMDASEQNDLARRNESIHRIIRFLIFRLFAWGIPGIWFAVNGLFPEYLKLIAAVYIAGALLAWCTDDPPQVCQPQPPENRPNDVVIMKRARHGLDNLLDIIIIVVRSLAAKMTTAVIECPQTKGQLAYPHKKACIHIEDGVAIVSVQLHFTGELDGAKFLERFNETMSQMLNAYELPSQPNPIFIDKNNNPYTSIQAIRSPIVNDYIILEVIRVTQEAVPLLESLENGQAVDHADNGQLCDDGD